MIKLIRKQKMEEEITISHGLNNIRNSKEIILGLLNKIYLLQEQVNSLKAENKKFSLMLKPNQKINKELEII